MNALTAWASTPPSDNSLAVGRTSEVNIFQSWVVVSKIVLKDLFQKVLLHTEFIQFGKSK